MQEAAGAHTAAKRLEAAIDSRKVRHTSPGAQCRCNKAAPSDMYPHQSSAVQELGIPAGTLLFLGSRAHRHRRNTSDPPLFAGCVCGISGLALEGVPRVAHDTKMAHPWAEGWLTMH